MKIEVPVLGSPERPTDGVDRDITRSLARLRKELRKFKA